MNYYKGTVEDQLTNLKLDSGFTEALESNDNPRICAFLIKDSPDNLKSNIKKIINKFRSKDDITKFLIGLINILNNDLNFWKYESTIKLIFNELEDESINFLNMSNDKSDSIKIYNYVVENQFDSFFASIQNYLDKEMSLPGLNTTFSHVCATLINFTSLLDIKNFDIILFPLTKFVEVLLTKFICFEIMHPVSINLLLHINHRMVNYLAVIPGNPISRGLRETIHIYSIIRDSIINMNFRDPEVITTALSILEHRSRFFGLNADAIPENENHGDYIVIDPLNAPFEEDDVYDDYEKFLATLPK